MSENASTFLLFRVCTATTCVTAGVNVTLFSCRVTCVLWKPFGQFEKIVYEPIHKGFSERGCVVVDVLQHFNDFILSEGVDEEGGGESGRCGRLSWRRGGRDGVFKRG